MNRRTHISMRWLALACLVALVPMAVAVPLGYRYIGSRVVSAGRIVYWYWNVDHVDIGPYGVSFVARMYARAIDVNQERAYVAVIRCDSRTYREYGSQAPYQAIDEGEPIHAVWRAGCDGGKAVALVERNARLNAGAQPAAATAAPVERPSQSAVAAAPVTATTTTTSAATAKPTATAVAQAPAKEETIDPRRADQCLRFADTKAAPAGDATITNTCAFPIEVTVCYKGGQGGPGGIYDCPVPAKGKRADSLGAGVTHVLPEYRRTRHKGIAAVACRGALGAVFPRLDEGSGKTGCS
ncbi:MAG: hypothetical protein ABI624_05440 [Casimicrobiaceae bacterium]